jgi:hypothetical protein
MSRCLSSDAGNYLESFIALAVNTFGDYIHNKNGLYELTPGQYKGKSLCLPY